MPRPPRSAVRAARRSRLVSESLAAVELAAAVDVAAAAAAGGDNAHAAALAARPVTSSPAAVAAALASMAELSGSSGGGGGASLEGLLPHLSLASFAAGSEPGVDGGGGELPVGSLLSMLDAGVHPGVESVGGGGAAGSARSELVASTLLEGFVLCGDAYEALSVDDGNGVDEIAEAEAAVAELIAQMQV
eukprot:90318-Chlamydomonas_euryale.AAC.2